MFNRPMLFVGVLVAAVVGPYLLLNEHLTQAAPRRLETAWSARRNRKETPYLRNCRPPPSASRSRRPPPATTIEQSLSLRT